MWDDLLELMETRSQMLSTTYRRHKYFADCDELLDRFDDKKAALENAKDATGILHEIQALSDQVNERNTKLFFSRLSLAEAKLKAER
jgi:hypothetical protein